jgi:hypothetical protein
LDLKERRTDHGENCIMTNFIDCANIISVFKSWWMRWAGLGARMGEGLGRDVYRVLIGRLEGKRPLGRPRRRREESINMDVREIGINEANWIGWLNTNSDGEFL